MALDSSLDAFDFFPKLEPQPLSPHASSASLTGGDTLDGPVSMSGLNANAGLLPASASGVSGVSGVSEISAATSAAESQATVTSETGGEKRGAKRARGAETEEVAEEKRQKKLELNRLASRVSAHVVCALFIAARCGDGVWGRGRG